jgi:hypothetical protein
MKDTPVAQERARRAPHSTDPSALLGEYAALSQHPGEENERLALAIRVVEALHIDALTARRPAAPAGSAP